MSNSEAVYFNGNYSPKNQTSLSILDRGFLFGDGVYELIPVYNKHIFYIKDHLSRLKSSLESINIDSSLVDDDEFINIINSLIKLNDYVIPRLGVYAVKVKTKSISKNGIANIGYRPTFNGQDLLLETNIFGINKNLYNKVINVNFIKFIRSEKRFKDLEQLKKQIKVDINRVKKNA